MSRYPTTRTKYCKIVGKTRVENVAEILHNLGFTVRVGEPENDDVDIWVFKDEELVLVIEVLNWRENVYMDYIRAAAILENFSNPHYHNLRKLLIFSFWRNIRNQIHFFDSLDIDFLEIGFQTQPTPYYDFFLHQKRVNDKRPNNRVTGNLVKAKLLAYLRERNLI